MKTIIHAVCTLFLLLLVFPQTIYAEEITYPLSAGEYRIIQDESGFHRILMSAQGYGVMESPGDPVLPQKMIELLVPGDTDWSSVTLTIENRNSETLAGSYNIAPNPPFKHDSEEDWGFGKSIVNGKNMLVYGEDGIYPDSFVTLLPHTVKKEPAVAGSGENTQQMRFEKRDYLRLAYRPFQYNPVTKALTLVREATVKITYNRIPSAAPGPASLLAPTYDYVIITTNDIVANSAKLANFIKVKEIFYSHSVKVVTETDFQGLAGQAPNGRAEKIRQWLIDNYIPLAIDYVLLIGDPDPVDVLDPADTVGEIPMKMCWPAYVSPTHRNSPTDYFYADLTGNWDLDGDLYSGEELSISNPVSPDPSIGSSTFSVRWTGKVMCDFNAEYEFMTNSNDGVRLYIDGNLVIDNWTYHALATDTWTHTMTAGKHDITLEFRENYGDGIIQLYYRTTVPNGDPCFIGQTIIPKTNLYNESDVVGGLTGRYYDNNDFTNLKVTRTDEVVNFNWCTGDMGSGGPDVGAEVFVGRIPVYNDDYAQLDSILQKMMFYETDSDISWRSSILLPMKPSDPLTPGWHLAEGILNDYAIAAGFSFHRIYEEDYSASGGPTPETWPCTADNVENEWKNWYGINTWWTHGSSEGAGGVFESSRAPHLDDSKPSFTFQASCSNGYPENSNNLQYALLKNGGIATVSATRVSWYAGGPCIFDPTSGVNHNLAYYYTKKAIDDGTAKPAGVALYMTKGDVLSQNMNLMDYNLYGDPETYLLETREDHPPVADAGGPYTRECQGTATTVVLDGSGTSDPDSGDELLYSWDTDCPSGSFDDPNSVNPTLTVDSAPGCFDCSVTLTVTDIVGRTGSANAPVTVQDTLPPYILCPENATVECTGNCGIEANDSQLASFFAGAATSDTCDADPSLGSDAASFFPVGTTPVIFTATDDCSNSSSCATSVTVVDTIPPDINVTLNRTELWPPNHKMVDIVATVNVTDVCDPNASFYLTSITSDEPDDGLGDGDEENDIQGADIGTADTVFQLRSERSGTGDGRTYTIVYTAYDSCDSVHINTKNATVYVYVPHDQSGKAKGYQGFNSFGTDFAKKAKTFSLVVLSTSDFNASGIEAQKASIGNTIGVIKNMRTSLTDLNADHRPDFVVTFSVNEARDLKARSEADNPLAFRYVTKNGISYLVPNIFALGLPLK